MKEEERGVGVRRRGGENKNNGGGNGAGRRGKHNLDFEDHVVLWIMNTSEYLK